MKDKFQETYDRMKAPDELKESVLAKMKEAQLLENPVSEPPKKTA